MNRGKEATRTVAKITYRGEYRVIEDTRQPEHKRFAVYRREFNPLEGRTISRLISRYPSQGEALFTIASDIYTDSIKRKGN